jgi:hypothetical protein
VKPDFLDKIIKYMCLLHNIVVDKKGEQQVVSFTYQQTQSGNKFGSLGENGSVSSAYTITEKKKERPA